jgi:hypothetical protein
VIHSAHIEEKTNEGDCDGRAMQQECGNRKCVQSSSGEALLTATTWRNENELVVQF